MAWQLSYTAGTGSSHSQSYWLPTRVEINKANKKGKIRFCGFKNAQARTDGKNPVGYKDYVVTSDQFDTYFATSVLDTAGKNVLSQCYTYADGEDTFFDNASDV